MQTYYKIKAIISFLLCIVSFGGGVGMLLHNVFKYHNLDSVKVEQEDLKCWQNTSYRRHSPRQLCDIRRTYVYGGEEYTFTLHGKEPTKGVTEIMYIDPYEPGELMSKSSDYKGAWGLIGVSLLFAFAGWSYGKRSYS